jgi:catecholate siderophore receptor
MADKFKAPRRGGRRAKQKADAWPIAYKWMAMGTLVAYSATGARIVPAAWAQDIQRPLPAPSAVRPTQGSQPVRRFQIAPGPLSAILPSFEQIAGLEVVAELPGILSVSSPGVSGVFIPEQALARLLHGTGLSYRFVSASTVSLDVARAVTAVDVTASVDVLAGASPKYSQEILDTPQTIATVSRETMERQGTTTLRDALRNVAGISLAAGEGGAQGDNLTIRGFTARNDLFIDGMRDFGSYYRDPFNTEEVEVLEGPSSVTFGRGSTGGVVNQTTKEPGLGRFLSADVTLGSDYTRRGTLDLGRPVARLGPGAAFRLNLMGDEGNVAGRDVAEVRRFGVAPSLALGLGTRTRWTFSYFHQSADDNPDYGIPWLFNGPAPVPRNNYYGFRSGNYLRTDDDIATARVEHDFGGNFNLRDQIREANYVRHALITEAQVPAGVTPATPLADIEVSRHEIGVDSSETYLADQLDISAHFDTGFVHHDMVAGVEAGRETSAPKRANWNNVPSTSLLHPNPQETFSGTAVVNSRVHTRALTTAAYVLDTAHLGKRWDVAGGFRWDRMNSDYQQRVAPVSSYNRLDNMPSWRAALVYKPARQASIYFAAGTSFNPSAESLSLSAGTASLPPEKNRTLEFGAKWDAAGSRVSLRTAVFRTTKLDAREPDPANPLLNVLAGEQRVEGVTVDFRARVTSRWNLTAGYAYLDGWMVSSNYYPAAVGARLANVPRNTCNFWSTFRLPWRWEAGVGGNYISSRTASSTAPFDAATGLVKEIPGYWVFNVMARHPLTEHLALQANVDNLAGRYYYDEPHPAHIIPGAARSVLLGLEFKF